MAEYADPDIVRWIDYEVVGFLGAVIMVTLRCILREWLLFLARAGIAPAGSVSLFLGHIPIE